MAVSTRQVELSTSPTLLVQSDSDGCTVYLHVKNTVYLGAAGVTSSTGLRLDTADGLQVIQLRENDALYAVVGSGTPTVTLMTVGN
jgi:hypothetical protein